ncbi:MAG: hypothetical protein H0V83_07205 [Rubrobacter sp.]|nr:hypothetical protein [Rubrobacter sp.]
MKLDGKGRPYGQVRTLIESLGGKMKWLPGGGAGGAWELTLGEYAHLVEVRDDNANALDRLYVPAVQNPQKIGDYPPDPNAELVDDAPERLVRLLFRG